jgi:16S rRNA (guanine527-N7)-methyltransferase
MSKSSDFKVRLQRAAELLHVRMDNQANDRLLSYIEQLQRWNKTYNLTALRDSEQMLVQHVFDSLSVVAPLEKILYKKTVSNPLVLDVGSGAGLPGLVIAVVQPHWQVECIDAVDKKMAFVRQMAGTLGLSNLQASHQRVESMPERNAHIVISRAFASLLDFATLAGRHVADNGYLVAMKGQQPDEEIDRLHKETRWRVFNIEALAVPELDARRCLVWMRLEGTV